MATLLETFHGNRASDNHWTFELRQPFNGAFGGTNGGVLSAISVYVVRSESGRRAASIDSRYLRGFRPGVARVETNSISQGRTLSVFNVSIYDSDDRLCTYSTVTLVEPTALATDILRGEFIPPDALPDIEQGKPWRQPAAGDGIPLIDTFEPTNLLRIDDTTTIASKVVWQEPGTSAEASCIAADLSVGPPVAGAIRGAASTPNPDLSLRFCGETTLGKHLISSCTLQNIDHGLATTRIRVWHQSTLLAIGISSTTCIPFR